MRAAAAKLRHVSVRCVNLGVGRENLTEKHWIYYPEDTVFHRIFVQGNASPHCNPPGGFGLTCEITYSPHKPLPCDGDALIERCIDDCIKVGMLTRGRPRSSPRNQVDMPYAYVVYDHARAAQRGSRSASGCATHDIILAGRYSEWEYYNSDHAFLAGQRAAETVKAALESTTRACGVHRIASQPMIIDAHLHCSGRETRRRRAARARRCRTSTSACCSRRFSTTATRLHDARVAARGEPAPGRRRLRGIVDRLVGLAVVNPVTRRRGRRSRTRDRRGRPARPQDGAERLVSVRRASPSRVYAKAAELDLPILFHSGIFIDGRSGRFCRPVFYEALREHPTCA